MVLELYPYGDTELWYAQSQDASWSLPLHVKWRHDKKSDRHYGMILPAVGLYYSQAKALDSMFGIHDIQGRKDHWIVSRTVIESILHKAPGITELAYYKWPDPDMPAIPVSNVLKVGIGSVAAGKATEVPSRHDSFVAHIASERGLQASLVKLVMSAICDEAPKWMLQQRKPLELGFCSLIALPFRPNWKEIVAFKFKKTRLCKLLFASKSEKWDRIEEAGMPQALCSPHNIGIKKSNGIFRISYIIEAIPSRVFEREAESLEIQRIACGTTSHAASFEKTVEALYRNIVHALEVYLRKTSLPFARVHERGDTGQLGFLPTTGNSCKVRGVGLRHIPVDIISPVSSFSVTAGQSERLLVQEKATCVQEMPAIQQGPDDMRNGTERSYVDEQGQLGAGADGVPVLDAGKG